MGKGREPLPAGGMRAHEDLVERIVSGAAGASREERARTVVEAVARLLEQDDAGAGAPRVLAELLEDDDAQERLAAWLGCPVTRAFALLGGAAVALCREPESANRRDRVSSALTLLLSLEDAARQRA